MPGGRRVVVVIEYEADSLAPEIMHEIGTIVRERVAEQTVLGARFVKAHAALGTTAFRVIEALGAKN